VTFFQKSNKLNRFVISIRIVILLYCCNIQTNTIKLFRYILKLSLQSLISLIITNNSSINVKLKIVSGLQHKKLIKMVRIISRIIRTIP